MKNNKIPAASRLFSPLRLLSLLFLLITAPTLQAAGSQTFSKELLSGSTPQPGEDVEYNLVTACSSLTSDCGELTITDTLPAELRIKSCVVPPGFTVVNCPVDGTDIEITKDDVLNGGDSLVITINTYVFLEAAPGAVFSNTASATITAPNEPENGTVDATSEEATVGATEPKWSLKKARIDPAVSLLPAADTDVRYTVSMCSDTAVGNQDITDAKLIDVFPVGASVVNADGGTVDANSITWDLGNLDIATLYASTAYSNRVCINKTYTLNYPSATFPIGTVIDNTLSATGTFPEGSEGPVGTDQVLSEEIGEPTPGAKHSKFAADVVAGVDGGPLQWALKANIDNSNAPVGDLVFYDQLPSAPAGVLPLSVTSGQWNSPATTNAPSGSDVRATIGYAITTPCQSVTYTDLATDLASPASAATYALPADAACVRWVFTDKAADGPALPRGWRFETAPVVEIGTTAIAGPFPQPVENCMFATYQNFDGSQGMSGRDCDTANVEDATPAIDIQKKTSTNNVPPGAEVQYTLTSQHVAGDSTGDSINPVITDLLPAELSFVSLDSITITGGSSAVVDPNFELIQDFNGSGRTLVRFSWGDTPPAGAMQLDGSAAVANPAAFEYGKKIVIKFTTQVKSGTLPAVYGNETQYFDNGPRYTCAQGQPDITDMDGDGDSAEKACYDRVGLTVVSAAVISGIKWIKGDHPTLSNIDDPITSPAVSNAECPTDGAGYTRFPCVAQTQHEGTFNYRIEIENMGNEALSEYIMYDVLPEVDDTGVGEPLAGFERGTNWRPQMTGPITALDVFTQNVMAQTGSVIEYSTGANPCRPEVSATTTESPEDHWQSGCDNDWAATPPAGDYSAVTAFRLRLPFTDAPYWEPTQVLRFQVDMQAPADAPPSVVGDADIFNPAWNSFAHRATQQSNSARLATSEPRQVGIVLPEAFRLGNLVWLDRNANGIANNGEPGIEGVTVEVWQDADANSIASTGDVKIDETITDANGKYAFTNLKAGSYYVVIPTPDTQAALSGLFSSSVNEEVTDDDGDNNDNGVLAITVSANGLGSSIVTLGTGASEPTNERLRAGRSDDDNDAYPDALSNYSVDFGFHLPCDMPEPTIVTACSDPGTPDDASDDIFSYTINVTDSGTGAGFYIRGDDTKNRLDYGADQGPFSSFLVNEGDQVITLIDRHQNSCQRTNVTLTVPNSCSSGGNPVVNIGPAGTCAVAVNTMDWGKLNWQDPLSDSSYPWVQTFSDVDGSGVDMTVTIPRKHRAGNAGYIDQPGDDIAVYTGSPDVLRFWHPNDADVDQVVVSFSRPVKAEQIVIGGNRNNGTYGVLEFMAYRNSDATGNVVLPNATTYTDPGSTQSVVRGIALTTDPAGAALTLTDSGDTAGADFNAGYVAGRQGYALVGLTATRNWGIIDYQDVEVRSFSWELYASDVDSPQTARDNRIASGESNSAYLGSFKFCVEPLPDLSLTKTANRTSAKRGETVIYTLTVTNDSSATATATGVQVEDLLPAGIRHISNIATQGTYTPGNGLWIIGDIDVGASVSLTITTVVD